MVRIIELNRTYSNVEYGLENSRSFAELLQDKSCNVVVVVGDKGSGKTTEISQFYAKNRKNSVWEHLSYVIKEREKFQEKLEAMFDVTAATYNIFLDSIDECRMSDIRGDSFRTAVEILCELLGKFTQKLVDTKILFTCRGSDWRGRLSWYAQQQYETDLDKQLIEDVFGRLAVVDDLGDKTCNTQQVPIKVKVFQLDNLTDEQKKIIAKHYNVNEDKLSNQLFKHFSNTPLECIQSLSFLRQNQTETYSMDDFFLYQLRYRYRELNDYRKSNMPIRVIEKMAKRLAVCTLFKQTLSIKKKDNYESVEIQDCVSCLELFPEEDQQTIEEFINSTIFSSNGLDRVKFWNETARNYLAYLWFKDRIANGKYRDIMNIVFQNEHPKKQFIPALIALSNCEPKIRTLLLQKHPELFVMNSYLCTDITSADKEKIIEDILKNYEHRIQWMLSWGQRSEINHFAYNLTHKFLLHKLKQALKKTRDAQLFVLELMDAIQIHNLSKQEIGIIKKSLYDIVSKYTGSVQYAAYVILTKFSDSDNIDYLIKMLDKAKSSHDRVTINLLLKTLYPVYVSLDNIIDIIIQYMESEQKDREYNFPFDYEIQYVIKNLHEEQLIQSILDKLKEHLINKSLCELYECFLLRFIEVSDNLDVISKYILELCKFEYKNHRFEKKKRFEIKEQVDKKEGLKYVIVRHALAMDKQIKRTYDGGYRYWMDVSKQYYSFDDSCAHIYLENCNDLFDEQDRKNLFDVAIMHFEQSSLENAEVQMSSYVSKNATIAKFYREYQRVEPKELSKFQKELLASEEIHEKNRQQEVEIVTNNLKHLKDLDDVGIDILYKIATRVNGVNEEINYDKLVSYFGEDIANVFTESIQRYWQITDVNIDNYIDTIGKNKILVKSLICIMGMSYFMKENKDIILSKDLCKKAIFYGLQMLNNTPDYVISYSQMYPDVFIDIVTPCIKKIGESNTLEHSLLWKLERFPRGLLGRLEELLFEILEKHPNNPNSYLIAEILSMVALGVTKQKILVKFINTKIRTIESPNLYDWFVLLYKISPKEFLRQINRIEAMFSTDEGLLHNFFERLFARLAEQSTASMDVETISKLVQIVYKYINIKEDIHRENTGVFTPTYRDEAQRFRSHLLDLLSPKHLSKASRTHLCVLADLFDTIDLDTANYLRSNADQLLFKDEELVWSENKVVKFEKEDYTDPTNSGELFDICLNRLLDIKEDIETSDYSIKELYQHLREDDDIKRKTIKEKYFQKYMLMEMRRLSNKLYSAVREPEVANNKKPDLQIWKQNWCVNIECKIADNWQFRDLQKAIDEQLIGKYLKYSKYQYGILLLARIGRKKWGKKDFQAILDDLQKYADNIKNIKYKHIKNIRVIGIDYKDNT